MLVVFLYFGWQIGLLCLIIKWEVIKILNNFISIIIGDLHKIRTVGRYFIETWKAAGMVKKQSIEISIENVQCQIFVGF